MNMTNEALVLSLPTFPRSSVGGWFIRTAAVILGITGVAKVWTAFAPTKVLAVADPFTGISFGHLMLTVGVLELIIAIICWFAKSLKLALVLIAWMATNFVVYRCGLLMIGWHKPCSCLGNLTDALHIPPQTADTAMKIILAYLLIGSYATLFWLWRQKRKQSVISPNSQLPTPNS